MHMTPTPAHDATPDAQPSAPREVHRHPARRDVLAAGAVAAAAVVAVAGCSSGSSGGSAGSSASAAGTAGGGSGGSGGQLASLSNIPVGGAVSAKDGAGNPIIVSQPTAGKAVAFSAICTHMGCTVAPADKILQCPCHGSQYNLATGDVIRGPAPKPLAAVAVHLSGDSVVAGGA